MAPSWLVWFGVAQTVLLALASLYAFSIRHAFKGGATYAALALRVTELERDHERHVEHVDGRFDKAGEKMSDMATEMQHLPDRLRNEFATRAVVDMAISEGRTDRDRISRDLNALWSVVRSGGGAVA